MVTVVVVSESMYVLLSIKSFWSTKAQKSKRRRENACNSRVSPFSLPKKKSQTLQTRRRSARLSGVRLRPAPWEGSFLFSFLQFWFQRLGKSLSPSFCPKSCGAWEEIRRVRQPFLVVVGSFLLDFFSLVDGDLNRRVSAFSSCRAARFGEVVFF